MEILILLIAIFCKYVSHLHESLQGALWFHVGPGRMEQAVADGRVDLEITYNPVPKAGVDFIEVSKIKMGVFGVDAFKTKKFADLPFVIPLHPAEGTPSKVMGLDGWPDHLFERNVKYRVTMMESALSICREGHAVASLPEKDGQQSVYLIRRHGAEETALERQLAKSLRNL